MNKDIPQCLQTALCLLEIELTGLPTRPYQEVSDFSVISSLIGIPNISADIAVQS